MLIGGKVFWSDKDNRNMRRVRASSPFFSLQICKNLYKLFVQFVQILLVGMQLFSFVQFLLVGMQKWILYKSVKKSVKNLDMVYFYLVLYNFY